ncbi:glycosyltransferase family 4 protein [Vibrio cholerae]|uniref:glycosyltransferase family 4 protein n=1 Tax=Vibrio cholerae TaxID=666 RepID=UPI0018F05C67|nr:glycosyltransferase family 4 protein [Vibrio cholerae]EKG0038837.1 glycosyltransferase family 4 protein [Vibrio cholerae]ELE2133766.1 glycosyltransferase family 4 protein [Vibrio cholerae]MBJ6968701.1 glycosyltransferase family 4 protein [Vibrio cholerae]MCD6730705.1 glycosyltransferase family 4 protein [Vibrio cholerae]HEJ2462275.1 glycosyltransferase family 4 protein [Vibrio cholerae]
MRIKIVNDIFLDYKGESYNIGGVETYLKNLYFLLASNGYDVTIFQKAINDFEKKHDGIHVVGLGGNGHILNDNAFLEKFKKNKLSSNDVVIWGSDQRSLKIKNKTICIQHGIGFDTEAFSSGLRRYIPRLKLVRLYKFMQRYRALRLFEKSDYAVCVDYNFLNWYRTYRKTPDKRIKVIPNFSIIPDERVPLHNKEIKILFARRFVKRRGLDIFIPAARRILSSFDNVTITFAGAGEEIVSIFDLKDDFKDRVFITSYSASDSLEFHKNYDISVIPSIGSEGTSLSLLEAMAAGCCVIATNVGGMTNIILDKFNGLLCNPNEHDLFDCMQTVITSDNQRALLQKNAYNSVKTAFSKDVWDEHWLTFINDITRKKL